MKFDVLETDRLILRKFEKSDFNDFCEYFLDKSINKNLGIFNVEQKEVYEKIFNSNINNKYVWGIQLKENGKIIGDCHFGQIVDGYLANVGFVLNKKYWGNGFAFEAVSKVIEYGFDNIGLGRIRATVLLRNKKSVNLLEKLGFQREALIYEFDIGNIIADILIFSKTDDITTW